IARRRHEHVDETLVRFRRFDRRLAENYLRHDKPYDCAGSFRIEGAGFGLFEAVTTDDRTALIGLPMIWLGGKLQELGYLLSCPVQRSHLCVLPPLFGPSTPARPTNVRELPRVAGSDGKAGTPRF